MALVVDDVHVVDRLGLVDEAADRGDRLGRGGVLRDRHVLRRHDAAGRVGLVAGQLPDLRRVLRLHAHEDLGDGLVRQHVDDVRRVVGVHLAEQLARLGRGQAPQDPRRLDRRQLLEDLRDLLVRAATG